MPTKAPSRNRSAEARAKGRTLRAFELTAEADAAIDSAAAHLSQSQGNCTRLQALEWLIRQGLAALPKKVGKK